MRKARNLMVPLLLFLLIVGMIPGNQADSSEPDESEITYFTISEGNNRNHFIYSSRASAHVIVTNAVDPKIIIAFPSGNSGIALWFDKSVNDGLALQIQGGLSPLDCSRGSTGIAFHVISNKRRILLTEVMLDSIREIRNHKKEASARVNRARHEYSRSHNTPMYWLEAHSFFCGVAGGVNIMRSTLKERDYKLLLLPGRDSRLELMPTGEVVIAASHDAEASFTVTALVPFENLTPYEKSELLSPETIHFEKILENEGKSGIAKERQDRFGEALKHLRFLSYHEKFLAGSWRFMTYFGRDTILSLLMLKDVINPEAFSCGLQSIIDRLSEDGEVAHEEDIGSWAEYRNIEPPAEVAPADFENPCFDYKMVDDDFLFPCMQAEYLLDSKKPGQSAQAFLDTVNARGEKNLVSLLRNWNHVLAKAAPFSTQPEFTHLIRIKPGEKVGDWRDSVEGLGGGAYPGSINVDLVAYSIRDIRRMAGSGLIKKEELMRISKDAHLGALLKALESQESGSLENLEESWLDSRELFEVRLSPDEMKRRLKSYIEGAHGREEKEYFLKAGLGGGVTIRDFIYEGKIPPSLSKGISFYALSLGDDGKPVEIMSSDLSFRLFLGEPEPEHIEAMLNLLDLPYPVGLGSEVGILVANPAYSLNNKHWHEFDRRKYHGSVVWGFQQYMIELGLARQIERFEKRGEPLSSRMRETLKRLQTSREYAGSLANSELWAYRIQEGRMAPSPFGVEKGSATESNAVQLWSTIFPAVLMKEYDIFRNSP